MCSRIYFKSNIFLKPFKLELTAQFNLLRYIKNVDKRTSRLDHKRDFRYAISQFSGVQEADAKDSTASKSDVSNQIQIYARKRPMLFAKEIKKDFDVIDAFPHAIPCPQIVVHDCRMKVHYISYSIIGHSQYVRVA